MRISLLLAGIHGPGAKRGAGQIGKVRNLHGALQPSLPPGFEIGQQGMDQRLLLFFLWFHIVQKQQNQNNNQYQF